MTRESKPTYYNSEYHKALFDIFLTYLNEPFDDLWKAAKTFKGVQIETLREYLTPENIEAGYHISMPGLLPIELDGIFSEIHRQAGKHRTLAIADFHQYHKLSEGPGVGFEFSPYFDIAFEAVWGGIYYRTCDECWYNEPFEMRTTGDHCHECDKRAFKEMVELIQAGEEPYFQSEILIRRNQFFKSYIFRTAEGLQEIQAFHAESYFRESPPTEYCFSRFIIGLVGFSLISFLQLYGSAQNLKKCPYCRLFFIAKDRKRLFCYQKECLKKDWRIRAQKLCENNILARYPKK